jgi:tRNA (guanine-N7-)-methyltransferase
MKLVTRDLHSSEFSKDNIMTEYEKKFSERGKNINKLIATK